MRSLKLVGNQMLVHDLRLDCALSDGVATLYHRDVIIGECLKRGGGWVFDPAYACEPTLAAAISREQFVGTGHNAMVGWLLDVDAGCRDALDRVSYE